MKTLTCKNLEDFVDNYQDILSQIDDKSVCLFDIDNVLYDSYLSLDFLLQRISKSKVKAINTLLKNNCSAWVFTDRHYIFLRLYLFHIKKIFRKKRNEIVFYNAQTGLDLKDSLYCPKRAIIYNTKKPDIYSEIILKSAWENFDKIFYFAGQDVPWEFRDKKLVQSLENNINLDKLIFIIV